MESMDDVLQELNSIRSDRSIDKGRIEEELSQMRGTVAQLHNSVVSLTKKLSALETQSSQTTQTKSETSTPTPTAPWVAKEITFLKADVRSLQGRVINLEKADQTKQGTVFGARLNTKEDLKDNSWKRINKCITVYTPSACFLQETCEFKAPINGDYYLDMAVRQEGNGSLEVGLSGKGSSKFQHSYVGNTKADSAVCHKTVIVSLNAGDLVHGIVRRIKGSATINWGAFHGCLVSASPSSSTPAGQSTPQSASPSASSFASASAPPSSPPSSDSRSSPPPYSECVASK